jgi:hypothetical protein
MPEPPTRTALVYGISIYDTDHGEGVDGTDNLTYTDNDALDLASSLASHGWTVETGISNLDAENDGSGVTRLAIKNDIAALAGTDGLVLFYYSGHGTTIDGEAAICPFGSVPLNINTYDELITVSDLVSMFEATGLKNVIVILDSCYSGGFVENGATVDGVPPIFDQSNFNKDIKYTWFIDSLGDAILGYLAYSADSNYVVISAAGSGEFSYEYDLPFEHGIFTYFLLQAIEADVNVADRDDNGYVTTSELYAYCAAGIDKYWNSEFTYADYLPHLSGTAREYALWATD